MIISKLKQSMKDFLPDWTFVYGTPQDVNRDMDTRRLPAVYVYLIDSGLLDESNGIVRERVTLALFFVNQTDFQTNWEANELIIDACRQEALKWYLNVRNGGAEFDIALNNSQRVYDEFDTIVTGYALNVTITDWEGVTLC